MPERYDTEDFVAELVAHGHVIPTAVQGGYGRGSVFEDILGRFDALVARVAAADGAETMTFPPIVARTLIEQVGYMDNFPQLCGSINSFFGTEREARALSERIHAGAPWDDALAITETMLTPAACYPVYPLFSGLLREGGRLITLAGLGLPPRAFARADAAAGVPGPRVRAGRHARRSAGLAQHVAGARARSAAHARTAGAQRCRQRPVLRPRRQDHGGEPARAGPEVRDPGAGDLRDQADRDLFVQLAPGPFQRHVRHPVQRRRDRQHRLPGVRPGARHPGPAQDPAVWTPPPGRPACAPSSGRDPRRRFARPGQARTPRARTACARAHLGREELLRRPLDRVAACLAARPVRDVRQRLRDRFRRRPVDLLQAAVRGPAHALRHRRAGADRVAALAGPCGRAPGSRQMDRGRGRCLGGCRTPRGRTIGTSTPRPRSCSTRSIPWRGAWGTSTTRGITCWRGKISSRCSRSTRCRRMRS